MNFFVWILKFGIILKIKYSNFNMGVDKSKCFIIRNDDDMNLKVWRIVV